MKTSLRVLAFLVLAVFFSSSFLSSQSRTVVVGHGSRSHLEEFYDYLLMKEIFSRAGFDFSIVEAPWARVLDLAREGRIDAVCNTLKTPERLEYLLFPEASLVSYTQNLFVRKPLALRYDGNLDDLAGLTIGVVRGFSYGEAFDALARSGAFKVYECADSGQLGEMLLAGRFDAAVENPIALYYETLDLSGFWSRVRQLEPPLTDRPAYLAFSRKSPRAAEFAAACDRALASMRADGTWDAIMAAAIRK